MTPWTDPLSPWKSQAAYFTWLRGNLRRAWMRYPVSNTFKTKVCRKARPADGFSKQVKFVGHCWRCNKLHPKSKLEVDHLHPAGELNAWNDVGSFIQRLLGCASDSLRIVCKPCHKIITHAERFKCTEAEAELQKKLIVFKKLPAAQQTALINRLFPSNDCSNSKNRAALYARHLSV